MAAEERPWRVIRNSTAAGSSTSAPVEPASGGRSGTDKP